MAGFSPWLQWFDSSGWLGLVSFVLTIVGFAVTVWNVWRSRSASEQARAAANSAVEEVLKLKVVTDLSSAISELEGVRRLLRENSWQQVAERLSYVRKLLIGVGIRHPQIPDQEALDLKAAIIVFADVEKQIDRAARGKTRLNADRVNQLLIDQIDRLVEIISQLV